MSMCVAMTNRSKVQKIRKCPRDNLRSQKMIDSSGTAVSDRNHQISGCVNRQPNPISLDPEECGHVEKPEKDRIILTNIAQTAPSLAANRLVQTMYSTSQNITDISSRFCSRQDQV